VIATKICSETRRTPYSTSPTTQWQHPYSRMQACFPKGVSPARKYWHPVNRIDNTYGNRNLGCSCPPVEAYASE